MVTRIHGGVRRAGLALALTAVLIGGRPGQAQTPATPAAPPTQAAQTSDAELVVTLIRTTMIALHQANTTGNYTVLRDLSAPDFRDRNTAVDLGRIFAALRPIDLSGAVLLNPNLSRASLTPDQRLHVTGALATRPVPVSFEMLFQPIGGSWRLYGIAVTPQDEVSPPLASKLVPEPPRKPSASQANRPKPQPQPRRAAQSDKTDQAPE